MKKIENIETELTKVIDITEENPQGKVVNLTYADLCLVNLNYMPQDGLLPTQMAERVGIINKCKDVKPHDYIELEDSEFNILLDCNQKTRWQAIHDDIVEFNKYILELK